MTQPSAPLSTDLPPISCLPGDALPWLPMSAGLPGLAIKYLHINAAEDTLTALLKMPAGGTLPRHRHEGEVFVHVAGGGATANTTGWRTPARRCSSRPVRIRRKRSARRVRT